MYLGTLLMAPSQYDNVMASLAKMREEIHDLNKALRDHASLEAEDRENLEERLRHALYGGNGEGPGIFERFRNIFDWREEHINSHDHLTVERRSSAADMRRFFLDVSKQALSVFIVVIAVLIVFAVTGKVVSFP